MGKREDVDQGKRSERGDALRRPPGSLRRQLIGSLVGAAIAILLQSAGRQLGWWTGDMVQFLLWGGVIGGLIGGSDALSQAGKRLTGRDEDWLNILVSLVGMVVLFGSLFAIIYALGSVLRGVLGR
jgi:uncharacterized membrane protein